MIDFVICSVPKYSLGAPLQGPAVLKTALARAGFSSCYFDLNEELYARMPELFSGMSWEEIEPVFAFEDAFLAAQPKLVPFIEHWVERILEKAPGNIGISVFTQRSFFMARALTERLRAKGYTRPVIWGGSYVGSCGKLYKQKGIIDHYVVGAGERVIVDFARGKRKLPGLDSPPIRGVDLKDYPTPDYSDLPMERYGGVYITASRSCPYHCSFCENPAVWGKFSLRRPCEVAQEIRFHHHRTNVRTFYFTDNLLNGHLPTYRNMMREIGALNLPVKFDAFFVVRSKKEMPPRDFELAKRAGARTLRIGVESGSESVRRHMRKRFKPEDLDYFLEQFERVQIKTDLMLIVGYPTETEEDFRQTLDLLDRYKGYSDSGVIGNVRIVPLAILTKAPLWEMREDLGIFYEGREIGDWSRGNLNREERLRRYHIARNHAISRGFRIRESQDKERNSIFGEKRSINFPNGAGLMPKAEKGKK